MLLEIFWAVLVLIAQSSGAHTSTQYCCTSRLQQRTKGEIQIATFTGLDFYSYPFSVFKELRNMHSIAFREHLLSFDYLLLTRTLYESTVALTVMKMYSNTVSRVFFEPAEKE